MVNNKQNQKGFTIIELLIATAILSTMLVMATFIMMTIGNLYYKGINQSKIQNNVRTVVSDLTDRLQVYDQDSIPALVTSDDGKTRAYCINGARYTFVLGKQLKSVPNPANQESYHVLWRDSIGAEECKPKNGVFDVSNPSTITGIEGQELMTPNGRLTVFNIDNTSPYSVRVGAAYGDQDLFVGGILQGITVRCNGGSSSAYCAVSYLETTVARRLGR